MINWFALYVKPRHEKVVATVLHNKGFVTCLPLIRSRREWCDRDAWVDMPAFPGYLFCQFDSEMRSPVMSTSGVVSIIGSGKSPLAIEPSDMERLTTLARTKPEAEPWPYLEKGQQVRIEGGSLNGLTGMLVDCRKTTMVVVSVALLQRSVAVQVSRNRVTPVTNRWRSTGGLWTDEAAKSIMKPLAS
jgi:transcription antitermination factor NusG